MDKHKYLVLIETSGIQRYIFSTNKLRENVGASELTYQIGTKMVLEAVGKGDVVERDPMGNKLREFLLDGRQNPFTDRDGHEIEVIIATSGKALLLTKTPEKAGEIVSFVTKKALIEMPGLTVHGAIVKVRDDLTDIHYAVGEVHRKLENIRDQLPSNLQRFQRLPFVEPCATSGLPASHVVNSKEDSFAFSKVSVSKRKALLADKKNLATNDTFHEGRIIKLLKTAFEVVLPKNVEKLEELFLQTRWLAVIHADGNGLGEIFLKFDEHLVGIVRNDDEKRTFKTRSDARTYIEKYRTFSIALDLCTINAAGFAIKTLQDLFMKNETKEAVPVIPLVLGGDDLTVLCDGEYAIKFAKDFLEQFEKETTEISKKFEINGVTIDLDYLAGTIDSVQGIIPDIANEALGVPRLGISAGIAIIKPHYPFHQAYDLTENLLKSAKLGKTKIKHNHKENEVVLPASAMDFHVLYDSSGVELKQIREKLVVDDETTYLYAKPYILTKERDLTKAIKKEWLEHRTWNQLEKRVCAMKAKDDDDKNKLPNSQLHHIRESLFRGHRETDSEVSLFRHRYSRRDQKRDKGFGKLLCARAVPTEDEKDRKEYSLFFPEKHLKDGDLVNGHTTHFLDAIEVVDLWKGFSEERCREVLKQESDKTEDRNGQ